MAWIETFTGIKVELGEGLEISEDSINIVDITRSLSQICRFNGHCYPFYSVAEHSINVANAVEDKFKLEALLHDAAEAYVGDMVRPIKKWLGLKYSELEHAFMKAIARKFNTVEARVTPHLCNAIWEADNQALVTERQQLKPEHKNSWGEVLDDMKPLNIRLKCYSPNEAFEKFIDMYNELYAARLRENQPWPYVQYCLENQNETRES